MRKPSDEILDAILAKILLLVALAVFILVEVLR